MAVSKDGYEIDISRVQSKRNLARFIKTYLIKETNVPKNKNEEEFWWKTKQKIMRKRFKKLPNIFSNFDNENENFDYEGIFDQKEKVVDNAPMKVNKSRMDITNLYGSMHKGKDEDFKFKKNSSQILNIQEEVSNHSNSPNSANSHQFYRRPKNKLKDVSIY